MQPTARRPLTEGDIPTRLRELAGPMVLGILAVAGFGLVDAWFLGKLGTTELAALGFAFPVMSLVFGLTLGMGVGTTATVSQALGAGDSEGVRRLVRDALALATGGVALASALGSATIEPVFQALGAAGGELEAVRDYMEIWYLGMPFLVIPIVGNAAIRATGDARFPAQLMVASALMNAALDPLFIWGWGPVPAFGIRGAAIASVLARVATLALSLKVLLFREHLVALTPPSPAELLEHWRRILVVGLPAAIGAALTPTAFAVITRIVARFGPEVVAAFGTGLRVHTFLAIPFGALSMAMTPFVGQNWGAARRDRIDGALSHARAVALGWGLLAWGLVLPTAPLVARTFSEDPVVVEELALLLRVIVAGLFAEGLFRVANSTLVATGRSLQATALAALKMFGLMIPLAALGASLAGSIGVYVAHVLATGAAGALAIGRAPPGELKRPAAATSSSD